ncbi:hypothetical protein LRS74_04740 [Streptomyces sp. LX-29]|uniref:hypothetical protein n=1 Tax=Streptomyces sp. LX-29 TaxID=2900152 RepID=UPI00240D9A12|nr:hypothetical protein [Streptomyces sp. LX-29]WFB06427.1 hypothetical protein LRS74_04740 [Streptomyces sp. LX-29]
MTVQGSPFDQRVRVLLELRGEASDRTLLEEELARLDWRVERIYEGARAADRVWLLCEARIAGARWGAARAVVRLVEELAHRAQLHVRARVAERIDRDADEPVHWVIYQEAATGSWRERAAARLTRRDTGRVVTADTRGQALDAARAHLPGSSHPVDGLGARRPMWAKEPTAGVARASRAESLRQQVRMVGAVLALMFAGAWTGSTWPSPATAFPALLAVAALAVIAAQTRILARGWWSDMRRAQAGALVIAAVPFALGLRAGLAQSSQASWNYLLIAVVAVVANGLRLLVRQWTWRHWLPWVLPLLLPLAIPLLPSLGGGLHLSYLDSFQLNADDVDVTAFWQLAAALKLVAYTSVSLVVPAVWGYCRHFHLLHTDRTVYGVMAFSALVASVVAALIVAIDEPREAAHRAQQAARELRAPAPYFGIEPTLVCVHPVKELSKVPVEGGELRPDLPYLLLGSSGGTSVLWDRAPGEPEPIKVPTSTLRIVPLPKGEPNCRPAATRR